MQYVYSVVHTLQLWRQALCSYGMEVLIIKKKENMVNLACDTDRVHVH